VKLDSSLLTRISSISKCDDFHIFPTSAHNMRIQTRTGLFHLGAGASRRRKRRRRKRRRWRRKRWRSNSRICERLFTANTHH